MSLKGLFTGTPPNYILYHENWLISVQNSITMKTNIASFCNSFFKPMFINNAYRPNPNEFPNNVR